MKVISDLPLLCYDCSKQEQKSERKIVLTFFYIYVDSHSNLREYSTVSGYKQEDAKNNLIARFVTNKI